MKKFFLFLFLSLLLMDCKPPEYADLILINGNIYTMDSLRPQVQALGVRNGIISYVGRNEKALKFKGDNTIVVDLGGKLMTPGLIEGHGHFMGLGYSQLTIDLSNTTSYDEIIKMVCKSVEKAEPGEWIIGRGWHQSKWDLLPVEMYQGFPTHIELSEISPNNPVVLRHASGHALLANAKAMEIAEIDMETSAINGGEVVKDNAGNPTGVFIESAMGLVSRFIPPNDKNTDKKAYKKTQIQHLGFGKRLMNNAEKIATEEYDVKKLAVISGIGARDWFYDLGYKLDGPYVSKIMK